MGGGVWGGLGGQEGEGEKEIKSRQLFFLNHRFQLEENGLFVLLFDAFEAFGAGVAGAGPFFFQASTEHGDSFLVAGDSVENGAEALGGDIEAAIFPKRVPGVEVVVGIRVVAIEGFEEAIERGGGVATHLGGPEVVVDLVERDGGGDKLEGLFGGGVVGETVLADAEIEVGFAVMGIRGADAEEPRGGFEESRFFPVVEAELEAGLGEGGVEAGGLREKAMFGGGVGDEEAADVVFEGVDTDAGTFGEERSFVEARVGKDFAKDSKAEAALEQGEIVEWPLFEKFVTLAEATEIKDTGLDQDGRFDDNGSILGLAKDFEGSVDDVVGIEFVADFDDGGASEERVWANAETLIGQGSIIAIKDEKAFARYRLMNHFGDAFADPIEILILG